MDKGYYTQITNCKGFKMETRISNIGQRTFVYQNGSYLKTFKTKKEAFDWIESK